MKRTLAAAGAGLLLAAAPVWAHHAFSAEFDVNKPLKLEGTLKKWEMVNPHSWFHLDVKGPDGAVVTWMVEGGSPNQLIRMGVTKNTVPVGTTLARGRVPSQGRHGEGRGQEFRVVRRLEAFSRRLCPGRRREVGSRRVLWTRLSAAGPKGPALLDLERARVESR